MTRDYTLKEAVRRAVIWLKQAHRCYPDGTPALPESIDEPEGRIRVIFTDTALNQITDFLERALEEKNR